MPADGESTDLLASLVIAAHNEAAVIGDNLDGLLADSSPGALDVVVVANGCSDDTAAVAATRAVRVLDLPDPGKAGALNAGDAAARGFPRIYLDADIGADLRTVRALVSALATPGAAGGAPVVAVPGRHLQTDGRPWPVRCYYAVQSRLPAARTGLYGRGMIALSREGRARFELFPDAVADDLFLDSLFDPTERVVVEDVWTEVATPFTTRDLVRRLTRVRRGNAELRAVVARGDVSQSRVRAADTTSWLRDVVLRDPRLLPAGAVYAALTLVAELRSRRTSTTWERDSSSRIARGAQAR
jgi:glycosyltransferase involved in cell wall biosynthesis